MRSSKVDHTYSDYSKVTEEEAALSLQKIRSGDQLITGSAPHGNVSEQNFPVKLHYMLCEIEADGLENIASWQPHGRCFLVHKLNEFVEQILPL